jgi:hypothetical protein
MKKLIVFIGILLLTGSAFSQQWGGLYGYFLERPQYEFWYCGFALKENPGGTWFYTLTPQKFKSMVDNPDNPYHIWVMNELDTRYSFFSDEKLYMLSYDTCETCHLPNWHTNMRLERGLYLFRLDDGGWKIASNKPVQIDWSECDKDGDFSYFSYFPKKFRDNNIKGFVNQLDNGNVEIRIINHQIIGNYGKLEHFYNDILLIPNGDETYNVQ